MIDPEAYRQQFQSLSGPAARQLARRLAAYLPITVTRQILDQSLAVPGQARWLQAATLFADISGFTRIAEELAVEGPRGAEELNRALLLTFTALINAIHDAGGAVSHFYGDAMMVYFDDADGRAARRALACGRFMQSLLLTSFARVTVEREAIKTSSYDLTIKIGVGYGRCLEVIVGDPETSLEFVLAGAAVTEAGVAQQKAQAGQVVASQAVLARAGLPATEAFRVVTEVAPVPRAQPLLYWEAFDLAALRRLLAIAPAFIPKVLCERLQSQNTQFVAEHRPTTSIFVRFEGIDDEIENAGARLQSYYLWARQIVGRFASGYGDDNGRVNRILTGDKGNQLHILFGAPVAPDAPEQAIRCALTLQREKPPFISHQYIGLAAGKVFACAVGSQNRREYTAVGNVVNLSARLAEACPAGAVVVDEATARRVADTIAFEQLAPVLTKGKAARIPLYRVIGEQTATTPVQLRQWRALPDYLSAEQALVQIRQRLGTDVLPPNVAQRLGLRDRQGRSSPVNRLFLEESLTVMLARGIMRVEVDEKGSGRVQVNETLLAQMQMPDTIYALLLAQLDQLSAAGRGLLQVAAVIGREFDLAALVALAPGMSLQFALDLLAEALATGIIQVGMPAPELTYLFVDALVHDVVYQSLPYARRQALHAGIAEWLVSHHAPNLQPYYPLLAYHYNHADRHEEGRKYAPASDEGAAIGIQ
jgi:class 3 adenylate cyclase